MRSYRGSSKTLLEKATRLCSIAQPPTPSPNGAPSGKSLVEHFLREADREERPLATPPSCGIDIVQILAPHVSATRRVISLTTVGSSLPDMIAVWIEGERVQLLLAALVAGADLAQVAARFFQLAALLLDARPLVEAHRQEQVDGGPAEPEHRPD